MAIEKPLAYLDHNILDLFAKGDWPELRNMLVELTQIIYSSETLSEIARSPEYANGFLDVLSTMQAKYIEIILDENNKITDKVRLGDVKPYDVYAMDQRQKKELPYPDTDALLHKMMGGQQGISFDAIIDSKKDELNKLLCNIQTGIPEIQQKVDSMLMKGHEVFEGLKSTMKASIPVSEEFDGKAYVRQYTGTAPKTLNTISDNEVLGQIQKLLGGKISIEDILGKKNSEAMALVNPNNSLYQNVCALYGFLEMLGYWSDRKLKENRRFRSFISDQQHVANAMFCDVLLTRDRAMAKKAIAVYEYFKIRTTVFFLKDEKD